MDCQETTQLLSQFIDDVLSLPVRASVDEHLDRCPVCRDEVAELRSISRSLRQLSRPVAPVGLVSSINDALMIEAAARRQVEGIFEGCDESSVMSAGDKVAHADATAGQPAIGAEETLERKELPQRSFDPFADVIFGHRACRSLKRC